MKFRVERDEFTDAVAWTARTLPTRATTQLQVLAGLLLDATGDGLKVAAFDYEVSAQADVAANVGDPGRGLVNGKMLADITKSLPDAPVDVAVDGTRLTLVCGNSRFALPMLPVDDYPSLPPMPETVTGVVPGLVFGSAVAQVAIAAGRDDTLPVLTAVRVEVTGDKLTLAATDRYRLGVRTIDWQRNTGDTEETTALVPAKTLADLARHAGKNDVVLHFGTGKSGEALAGFEIAGRKTTTRLIEGTFPPYRKLLPDSTPLAARVDIGPLTEAVKRVALVAPRTAPVKLTFTTDNLVLEAGTGGEAQASEALPVAYDGPELVVHYNPAYLLDALGVIEEKTAQFGFASAEDMTLAGNKPAILTGVSGDENAEVNPDGYRYLLMPIRSNG
ncbi:DNA polymerase III subunit beta [Glutamicibacter sp. V16R2B1]|uniref:DNA polymerase III subunit beta n=1 Tax=Glutamicibacter sp. V16R2B1 TaxID=2036207 RepID=UPI0010FF38D8|nr:DNA polymerase III subunit beta [Glutamicibacter sp. V16R2B1]MCK9901229.1 DNA polymerase III subunit beta [Frankia sp. Cpl3]TLK47400.1 DNA polymerase III subunit beta [Glutamicibacter sp. V16R2B1]